MVFGALKDDGVVVFVVGVVIVSSVLNVVVGISSTPLSLNVWNQLVQIRQYHDVTVHVQDGFDGHGWRRCLGSDGCCILLTAILLSLQIQDLMRHESIVATQGDSVIQILGVDMLL